MAHVFISYVRADADKVDRLALDLYRHGIDAWTDRDLRPGQRWKFTIRQAIRQGAAFLACFSPEVFERDRTYMYEEITTAVEVLRETPAASIRLPSGAGAVPRYEGPRRLSCAEGKSHLQAIARAGTASFGNGTNCPAAGSAGGRGSRSHDDRQVVRSICRATSLFDDL